MASTGISSWTKHFQGKGDLQTTMKKDASAYDAEKGTKKVGTIKAGEKIVYVMTKRFEQRALVLWGEKYVRVPFDSIAKPGVKSSGAASLKPQAFGVRDNKYAYNTYVKLVLDSIEERKDLRPALKTYLYALFDYNAKGRTTKSQLQKIYNETKDELPINDINKDFGEVVGPLACVKGKILASKGVNLTTSAKIYMPERPNEPLMDYGIYQGTKQYVISAKSGETTNVVKPPDIINLLKINPAKVRKWKNTKEWAMLTMLSENSILLGPIKAVAAMYPDLIDAKAADNVTKDTYDINGFKKFIASNDYLKNVKGIPTSHEIRYECEKLIQSETKSGTLNMNKIFSDAIQEQVLYVKFEIGDGTGKWSVIASDDIANVSTFKRIYLRTKNGYTRAADRMGVQV